MEDMIKLHLNGNLQLFFSNTIQNKNYDIYYNNIIDDEYWNYAYIKNNQVDLRKIIQDIKSKMKEINRKPVIYITSNIMNEKLKYDIEKLNLKLLYTDSWMFLDNIDKLGTYKSSVDFSIHKVNENLQAKFVQAVMDGFSEDNPEDPYNNLPEGYRISLERSFKNDNDGKIKMINYIGIKNSEPISTATVIFSQPRAVMYNITTSKKYKNKGVCKQMMFHIINDLNKLNIKQICLQTEKGYYTRRCLCEIRIQRKDGRNCIYERRRIEMFIVAQLFGILTIISNVIAMQMKNKKQIIFCYILANFFSSINFMLLKSYSGAIICLFAIIQTFINNFFEKNEKKMPYTLISLYIIISIILGAITFRTYIDILPIICSILYTLIIIQNKEKNIRKIALINIMIWVVYDILYKAYTASISDSITTISTIIGIYRFDIKKEKNI